LRAGRSLFLLGLLVVIAGAVSVMPMRRNADAMPNGWIGADIDGLHYEVLPPEAYDKTKRYPMVLYLHQLDMGNYPAGLLKQVDGWFATPAFRARHTAIVVVPMLDQTKDPDGRLVNFGGKRDGQFGEDATIAALRQVMGGYSVDPARIYVTGNSMGGIGTWQMLLDYNIRTGSKGQLFAAGIPVAGAHRTADAAAAAKVLRQVPIWAIHGARDTNVSPDWDRTMSGLLRDSKTFRYTEDASLGHEVWDRYYVRPDVWDWLFAQRAGA